MHCMRMRVISVVTPTGFEEARTVCRRGRIQCVPGPIWLFGRGLGTRLEPSLHRESTDYLMESP